MMHRKILFFILALTLPAGTLAQNVKIVTNQVGYEDTQAKKAIIVTDKQYARLNW